MGTASRRNARDLRRGLYREVASPASGGRSHPLLSGAICWQGLLSYQGAADLPPGSMMPRDKLEYTLALRG